MDLPKKKRFARLKNRYRLVLLNDDTLAERLSFKLTPLNVFIAIGFSSILLVFIVASLIAFTPLRAYLPGYADEVKMKRQLIKLSIATDSLENELRIQNVYAQNIRNILNGNIVKDTISEKSKEGNNYKNIAIEASPGESAMQKKIEEEEKYNVAPATTTSSLHTKNTPQNFFFFTPVNGFITASFEPTNGHYGIDIAAKENESIKAVLDGTVISSGWTPDNGHVIQLQHDHNLISAYKHNSALLKKTGQHVKAGEVIAIIGNSGELSSGPHLHFELWYNGTAIDPQEYIAF